MHQYIHNIELRFQCSSNCAQQNQNFIIQKNYRTTEELTKKNTSPQYIVNMQEKRKDADYIVKKIHVKPINLTIKHGTNSLKLFADMETPTNLIMFHSEILNP